MSRKRTPESLVTKAVTDLLTAKRIPYWRLNAGDRFGTHNGKKWRIRGQEPGTADLLAAPFRDGVCEGMGVRDYLWIEVKAPGGKQSAEQRLFQNYVEGLGMRYALVRSAEDLLAAIGSSC